MTDDFQRRLADATRRTRAGDLAGATAVIRAALGLERASAADDPLVVDVEAREVDPPRVVMLAPAVQPVPGEVRQGGSPVAAGVVVDGRHGTGLQARDWRLHLPPPTGMPVPLVVMLHGCTQDLDDFATGTAMHEVAAARGWAVLYPQQSPRANPQRCWNWFKHSHQERGRGEPAWLAGLITRTVAAHGIDPARVYVAGLSAGGAMAALLGTLYPDVVAAVGVHSGLPPGSARDLPGALRAMQQGAGSSRMTPGVPVVVFHGDADGTVHPANGEALFDAAGAAVRTERGRVPGGRTWSRRQRLDADGRVLAEHWLVHGGGHAWSGGRPTGSHTDPGGPDASAAMLRFFAGHARRR